MIYGGTYDIEYSQDKYKVPSNQIKETEPIIKFRYNDIEFRWATPYFIQEKELKYSYRLAGFDNKWSKWSDKFFKEYTNLPYGNYTMNVKAVNIYGDESIPATYSFTIQRPWYATYIAVLCYLLLLSLVVAAIVTIYTKKLRTRAIALEKHNLEIERQRSELEIRNIEVVNQKKELENLNDEITAQRDEIEAQRDSLVLSKEMIDQQNTSITDSIKYARRIQDAVMPSSDVMRFLLPKHFVFYEPRDIVSGDFFWVDKKDDRVLIALGDCTGHGVPGAFMSMLGISLLNEISSKYSNYSTGELMDELRDQVIASLKQTGEAEEAKDGMDMGLLALNSRTHEIQFSGAYHNLYIFSGGVLNEVKGDRMPVGIHSKSGKLFQTNNFKLKRGDSVYLFSDGFPDQFGGEQGKKYGYPRLKRLLGDIQDLIMYDQLNAVKEEFSSWKNDLDQIDDVLLIGVKI